ncbi:MAG: cytochrome ubiquinol oxidase subunit I [Gammaproteobacteria bacterium]|jgi:cytochrome d ubiquinol oxidase subunit I|nr:cytochrome ubiquinol oxidase subunit I [Gammaproteobacteria bacterium]
MDAEILARVQFAFTVSFHILFPAFTIGLASWLVMLEALWLKTGKPAYMSLYKFWLKIFAVSFGMGVVSGIVMSFQFGSNWSGFSEATGNVLGPVIGYEVLTAFFLEATFLGIMLFGANRVSKGLHFFSTCMVALGTLISAFWILSANSWMNTPAGFSVENGIFYPEDWFQIIFNPSFPYRLVHMTLAAYLTTCFVIGAVSARYLLEGRFQQRARHMFFMSVIFGVIVVPAQVLIGDFHGLNTKEYQPQKVAAMEAHWESEPRAPLILFAIPDEENETNHFQLGIPGLGSLILEHDINAPVTGLKEFPAEERPPVAPVFWAFRIMVGLGILMLFAAGAGVVQLIRGRLYQTRWLLKLYSWMWPTGFIAVLAGWFTTEIGRQPWVVWELQTTADALSPVPGASVATSLLLFFLVYGLVFGAGIYYLLQLIRSGPGEVEGEPEKGTARRPLSAAGKPAEEGT